LSDPALEDKIRNAEIPECQLKILLTADPELPVPPIQYGGIERIVHLLAEGLVNRGHDVTLIAHARSRTRAKLTPFKSLDPGSLVGLLSHSALVSRTIALSAFDVVHSHSRLAYMAPVLGMRVPKLMSYQRKVTPRSIKWARRLAGNSIEFSAVSQDMIADVQHLAPWHVVYNGVPIGAYTYQAAVGTNAPLTFLGRIEPIKGPHLAIEIAKHSKTPLVIAGNIPAEHQGYFQTEVAPHLDGTSISYLGPVDDAEKNVLLGRAKAFLMPILWDEPFGIVMAEALACGTPVIGLRRGSVPEVVSDGVTGFVCSDMNDMVRAVGRVGQLDRSACRARAEAMFSEDSVVDGFLTIYHRLICAASTTRFDDLRP
jgi:glycosyltransferase involved in cell wall biosynthesis